jgi:chemotaxis protein MotB
MINSNDYTALFMGADDSKLYTRNTWLITFADLLSLLLVFFILIYSTSNVKKDRLQNVIQSLDKKFGSSKILKEKEVKPSYKSEKQLLLRGVDLDYLYALLQNRIGAEAPLAQKITLKNNGSSLVISIKNKDIFGGNTPVLSDDFKVLYAIAEALQKFNNKISITTHIDSPHGSGVPKDWNLAIRRAVAIAEELKKMGNSSRLEARVQMDNLQDVEIVVYEFMR